MVEGISKIIAETKNNLSGQIPTFNLLCPYPIMIRDNKGYLFYQCGLFNQRCASVNYEEGKEPIVDRNKMKACFDNLEMNGLEIKSFFR